MALVVNFTEGGNKVIIPGAVEVTDLGHGEISIKLLTTPDKKWVDQKYNRVPSNTGMTFRGHRFSGETVPSAFEYLFDVHDNWSMDPHKYLNGSKMTIAESVTRATNRVYDDTAWWGTYSSLDKGDKKDLARIVKKIIRDGHGRDEVYRLGGKAKTLRKEGFGKYSLVKLFELAALYDRVITEPVLG
jgi:hypothetical protein